MARQKINVRFEKDVIETELKRLGELNGLTASDIARAAMNIGLYRIGITGRNTEGIKEWINYKQKP